MHAKEVQRSKYILIDDNRFHEGESDENEAIFGKGELNKKNLKQLLGVETEEIKILR